jgi:hypothetical protein
MNKFVFSALATGVVSVTGFASETEWPELDRELEALHTTLQTQTSTPFALSGWVIAAWDTTDDVQVTATLPDGTTQTGDIGGFDMRSVRLRAEGDVRNYGYRIEFDFGDGVSSEGDGNGGFGNPFLMSSSPPAADPSYEAQLLDAYGNVTVADSFKIQVGRFRQPFLQSALIDRNRTLFINRSFLGQEFSAREEGVMLSGEFSMVGWWLAAQNGLDGRSDQYLLTGRVAVDLMGEGAGHNSETAYNAPEGTNLMLAGAISNDDAVDSGTSFGAELYLTSGPFYLSGELANRDEGYDFGAVAPSARTPWAVSAAYLIANAYEFALRWDEFDRTFSTTDSSGDRSYTAGLNWYHDDWNTKWTIQWQRFDSRDNAFDADVISAGLTVSF